MSHENGSAPTPDVEAIIADQALTARTKAYEYLVVEAGLNVKAIALVCVVADPESTVDLLVPMASPRPDAIDDPVVADAMQWGLLQAANGVKPLPDSAA